MLGNDNSCTVPECSKIDVDIRHRIFFVDDEPSICKAVSRTLAELNATVTCFTRPADCLAVLADHSCDLVISDVNMPGMNGLELLKAIKTIHPLLPVVLITGYGDIPIAVKAVKAGALDFIEKPLDEETFLPLVRSILTQGSRRNSVFEPGLTPAECRILGMIVDGLGNKEIAFQLGCSVRTVENHRYRMMHKLNVDGTAGLVKTAILKGLVPSERLIQPQIPQ